jgi:callose synthase
MESDSASTEDLIAYNIIPIDAASSTNAIVFFPEVLKLLYLRSLFYM